MNQFENLPKTNLERKPSLLLRKARAFLRLLILPTSFFVVGLFLSHYAHEIKIDLTWASLGTYSLSDGVEKVESFLPAELEAYLHPKAAEKIVIHVSDAKVAQALSSNSNISSKVQVLFSPETPHSTPVSSNISDKVATQIANPAPKIYAMGEQPADHFADPNTTKTDILTDKLNRIPEQLHISDTLMKRTAFWFDVYTKYDSGDYLIHHSDFPWIIFRVVNADHIFKARGNKWVNYHKGRKYIDREKAHVIAVLKKLSKTRNFERLAGDEKVLFDMLAEVPGKRVAVFKRAAAALRIQLGQKDFFQNGLIASSQYLHGMEEIFAKYDLPIELTRLPLVESSFNLKAVSKVGASGIWQFMPGTGKISKLRVGNNVDERNSPIKATEAAAKLLLENFRLLKSWPLAMTAYNHGPGGVKKASQVAQTKDLGLIISRYKSERFGFASSNFYTEYLAALHAERYQEEVLGNIPKHQPLVSDQVRLKYSMRARSLADLVGMTLEEMRLYNPDLKAKALEANFSLPRGYNLHVPAGHKEQLNSVRLEAADSNSPDESKVRRASSRLKKTSRGSEKSPAKTSTEDTKSKVSAVPKVASSGIKSKKPPLVISFEPSESSSEKDASFGPHLREKSSDYFEKDSSETISEIQKDAASAM